MPVLMFIVGLLVGAALGAAAALLRNRAAADRRRSDLEVRAVAAETQRDSLARLIEARDAEAKGLRDFLDVERTGRREADTRLEERTRAIEEQRGQLAQAEEKLVAVFKSLAADALKSSNEDFLKLAQETLRTYVEQSKGDLGLRQQAIAALVKPLADTLGTLNQQVRQLELRGQETYAGTRQYLESVSGAQQALQNETRKLVAALREPRARGRWGELTLRRVVEVAGMSEHCDFVEQASVEAEDGRLRPDMVIHLPGGRQAVVDSKAPMDAYLTALGAETEEARRDALHHHARQIRQHLAQLSARKYWEQFTPTPEMVVLFVPGESFFSAALDCDQTLIEDGAAKRVILASPTTLIALLRAVSYGWQQAEVARHAEQISSLGRELHERIRAWVGHLLGVQKALRTAVDRFNQAVGSLEGRVLPGARKFKELGAASGEEIEQIEPIDAAPRQLPVEAERNDEPANKE